MKLPVKINLAPFCMLTAQSSSGVITAITDLSFSFDVLS